MKTLAAVLFLARLAAGQTAPPVLPYLDWKACPGEGCAYRQWTVRRAVTAYDDWQEGRHAVAALEVGEKVTGLTGVVITFTPGTIRMDRDLPEARLKRGDVIQTYTYRGEGFSAVWFKGKFDPEFDISFAKYLDGSGCGGDHCAATYVDLGKKVWWAQVKLATGRLAWVDMELDTLDGICMIE